MGSDLGGWGGGALRACISKGLMEQLRTVNTQIFLTFVFRGSSLFAYREGSKSFEQFQDATFKNERVCRSLRLSHSCVVSQCKKLT